jgi:hypothetical protein
MTAQEPDLIRFEPEGELHDLCTNPLEDWLHQQGIGARPIEGNRWGFASTANYRGYVATFLIHDGRLWIEDVDPQINAVVAAKRRERWIPREDGSQGEDHEVESDDDLRPRILRINPKQRPFTFEGLFPTEPESNDPEDPVHVRDAQGRARADWYSGELRIPQGEMTRYVHGGYGSEYERDRLVMVEQGRVVRDWVRENG